MDSLPAEPQGKSKNAGVGNLSLLQGIFPIKDKHKGNYNVVYVKPQGFLGGSVVKNQPAMQETQETRVQFLDWEDPLEKGMATHSSILARRIPWTEEPRELRSIGSRRVGHD